MKLALDRMAADPATVLRRGVIGLAGLGIAGTAIELVFLRHWTTLTELIVWPAMLALAIGLWFVARRPTPSSLRGARVVAAIVLVVAVLGVAIHVIANVQAGPLDQQFEMTWASLSVIEQWWLALTGGVGPAPTLAPAALAEIALATILATVAHPVFRMPSEASAI